MVLLRHGTWVPMASSRWGGSLVVSLDLPVRYRSCRWRSPASGSSVPTLYCGRRSRRKYGLVSRCLGGGFVVRANRRMGELKACPASWRVRICRGLRGLPEVSPVKSEGRLRATAPALPQGRMGRVIRPKPMGTDQRCPEPEERENQSATGWEPFFAVPGL